MDEVIFRKWECNWLYILNVISKANSLSITFSSVQSLSRVWLFVTLWIAVRQASVAITKCWSLPKLMSIELVMPSSHLILCGPPNPSQHQALFHYLSLPPKRHQPTATGITRDRALTLSEAHVFNSPWKNFPIYVIAEKFRKFRVSCQWIKKHSLKKLWRQWHSRISLVHVFSIFSSPSPFAVLLSEVFTPSHCICVSALRRAQRNR